AQLRQVGLSVADRNPVDGDGAFLERLQPGDAFDHRRLSGSRGAAHNHHVAFAYPDGPHTTTTSPLATSVLQFFSTCMVPYHLLTLLMVIMRPQRMMATRCCRRRAQWDAASEMTK